MEKLTFILIVLPFLSAIFCYITPYRKIRFSIVMATAFLLIMSSLTLIRITPFSFSPITVLGADIHHIVLILDFLILFLIFYFGIKHHNLLIIVVAILQIVLLGYLEYFMIKEQTVSPIFYCDYLSLIMILIISIVGSIICIQSIPYMKNHEEHLELRISREPRFFGVMLLFLGAMNGLVLSNDLLFLYFFFEITTLCSFLLIGHDNTERTIRNAVRALWMNSLGGALFIIALVILNSQIGALDMQKIIHTPKAGLWFLPIALLCFAAFTKSAQFPFQSWLLGAMVAPTPVSALLHSSTMVKIGVYLVLRLGPAIQGTFLSHCVAIFGAFTFLAAAALAVGQSNGKKVLAYSTISNLGLIFACAGINSSAAITAGILLIIFHAITKALLFLCVGVIEQHIESRDIEDMRGLYSKMPVTALITVIGVITMIMPPFGLLLGKWMAIEAASRNIFVIIILALGSALTVMYWARWAGILMSDPFAGKFKTEKQPILTWVSLVSLCLGATLLSMISPWLYSWMIIPTFNEKYLQSYTVTRGILENPSGSFAVIPLSILALIGFFVSVLAVRKALRARVVPPYLSGVQLSEPGMFLGPMNQPVKAEAKNYYLSSIFGEQQLTIWVNLVATVLITMLIGGAL